MILGLPYYGITWPTESAALGAARTGTGSTYTPRRNIGKPASLGVPLLYEPGEAVSWYAWYDQAASTWRQVFYDTPTSLRPKYALRHLPAAWPASGSGRSATTAASRGTGTSSSRCSGRRGWPPSRFPRAPPGTLAVTAAVTATPGSRVVTEVRFGRDGTTWNAWRPLPAPTADGSGITVPPSFAVSVNGAGRDGPRTV